MSWMEQLMSTGGGWQDQVGGLSMDEVHHRRKRHAPVPKYSRYWSTNTKFILERNDKGKVRDGYIKRYVRDHEGLMKFLALIYRVVSFNSIKGKSNMKILWGGGGICNEEFCIKNNEKIIV